MGFHTVMALAPAYHMAAELPAGQTPLPVLKVLYRNNRRIQDVGGRKAEKLRPVAKTGFNEAETAISPCNAAFLDPDNGLEADSVEKHHKKAIKYAFLDEVAKFASTNRVCVVYHHRQGQTAHNNYPKIHATIRKSHWAMWTRNGS